MAHLRRRRTAATPGDEVEDPLVRQYRFVLRTAQLDAQMGVTEAGLSGLDRADRDEMLRAIQVELLVGERTSVDDLPVLARLAVLGEQRRPGALLGGADLGTLHRFAEAALTNEAAFGLLAHYADWDGEDPVGPAEEHWSSPRWGTNVRDRVRKVESANEAFGTQEW